MKALFLSLLLTALSAPLAQAAERTARILAAELTCPSCSYIVATAIKSVKGVRILEFAQGKQEFTGIYTVAYDDKQTSPQDIVAAILDYGYPAKPLADNGS